VGRPQDARRILRQLEQWAGQRYVSPIHFAYIYAGLGEADTAIDYLDRALQERSGGIYGVKGSFLFTSLRGHPRFKALLGRMGLGS
jgi:hypothetical protein